MKKQDDNFQGMLPYKDIEYLIKQIESDDARARAEAIKNIKNFGEIASFKLIEKIKNNPQKIDSYIVIALDELGKKAHIPIIRNLSSIKNLRSLKDLIFLETLLEVAKDIFSKKDKELLHKLLFMVEKAATGRKRNKLFQSFCRNAKIKIFECLFELNDKTVYKYVVRELQNDSVVLTNIIVDILKKFGDTEIVGLLLEIYKSQWHPRSLNAGLVKNIIRSVYKRSNMDLETFTTNSKITNPSDIVLLSSILR